MVDGKRQPMLLRLILFLVGEYVEDGILPHLLRRFQAAEVVVHEGLDGLVNVINHAFQLVVFVGVNLSEKSFKCFQRDSNSTHLMPEDHALLNQRFRQQHRVLLVNQRVSCAVYEQIILRQKVGGLQGKIRFLQRVPNHPVVAEILLGEERA